MRYTVQSNGDEEDEEEEEGLEEVCSTAQSTPNRTDAASEIPRNVAEVEVHEQSQAASSSPCETTETLTIPNGDAPAISLTDNPLENDASAGDVGSRREGTSDSVESHELRPAVREAQEDDRPPVASRAKQKKTYDLFAITVGALVYDSWDEPYTSETESGRLYCMHGSVHMNYVKYHHSTPNPRELVEY